jgi:mannose-6-phosphate isomerase-like protein (cupin superfamily)
LANEISIPVSSFFEEVDNDLDDGIKIARRDETFNRKEVRDGKDYYTYHHLVTTNAEPSLMALRLDLHCEEAANIALNRGHGSKELVYVTKGKVQVQWTNTEGTRREDVLNEGDSIFVYPETPHSFTAIDNSHPAEIIAVNYG